MFWRTVAADQSAIASLDRGNAEDLKGAVKRVLRRKVRDQVSLSSCSPFPSLWGGNRAEAPSLQDFWELFGDLQPHATARGGSPLRLRREAIGNYRLRALRDRPFQGPPTIKPPVLLEDTYSSMDDISRPILRIPQLCPQESQGSFPACTMEVKKIHKIAILESELLAVRRMFCAVDRDSGRCSP